MIEAQRAPAGSPRCLYLGEGPGSGGYLEGVLSTAFDVGRAYASQQLDDVPDVAAQLGDSPLIILSDFPAAHLTDTQQRTIVEAVEQRGAGLLMIGGWASFSGPRSGYRGTPIANLLPVECAADDDRYNTPLGTVLIASQEPHPAIKTIRSAEPCVVVGFNQVAARQGGRVLIAGYELKVDPAGPSARLERSSTPVLTVWERGKGRVAALAPDVTPHWAGGIIDWGSQRVKLPTGNEIGDLYQAFLLDLCQWVAGKTS